MSETNHDISTLNRYFKNTRGGGYKNKLEREEFWDEGKLCSEIADYLRTHHPTVPFFFDLSGIKMSKSGATRAVKQRAEGFRVPDLIILVKKRPFGMLALEIKKLGTTIYKRDGNIVKNEHIHEQISSIRWLRKYSQCADFGIGYMNTIKKINEYLSFGKFEYLLKD